MLAGLEGDLQRGLWARALADCFRRELERLSVGDPALDIVQTSFATQLSQVSFAKTPPADQVVDLPPLMRRQSPVDDHPPALLASTPPDPLRRPPPGRSGEPRLAPATRRLQENGDPAQDSGDGSPLLGLAGQGLGRVEAAPRDRYPRHRPAVAAATLPPTLDQALRPAHRRPPVRQRRDQGPRHANGRGQSALGRPTNPCRVPEARPRRG